MLAIDNPEALLRRCHCADHPSRINAPNHHHYHYHDNHYHHYHYHHYHHRHHFLLLHSLLLFHLIRRSFSATAKAPPPGILTMSFGNGSPIQTQDPVRPQPIPAAGSPAGGADSNTAGPDKGSNSSTIIITASIVGGSIVLTGVLATSTSTSPSQSQPLHHEVPTKVRLADLPPPYSIASSSTGTTTTSDRSLSPSAVQGYVVVPVAGAAHPRLDFREVTTTRPAVEPEEISITLNQRVVVLQELPDGWALVESDKGERGYVPLDHLKKI
ncbi:uncharacterized protein BJ171DRAFT_582257 [Polychytrium aggregatum]|uniref:uncharacterized protein n=1 Tax=Polychytrium aggregatum TaxID=110093 RepID=UPI0022FDE1F7|nr:uncharacterized protein BJ171DRAFT_582257 [Polychytrium aggregatum]KAI9204281.1 hypothetical protein BJ171DRAFT_582257 [Polychytrium aggregatum]